MVLALIKITNPISLFCLKEYIYAIGISVLLM